MKRKAQALVFLAALGGGCMSTQKVDPSGQVHNGVAGTAQGVPHAVGPWGEPVVSRAGMKPSAESGIRQTSYSDCDNCAPGGHGGKHGHNVAQTPMPMPGTSPIAGAVAATGALVGGPGGMYGMGRTSVRFVGPAGLKVAWFSNGGFGPTMVEAPGRYNFPQGGAYRLKLTDFPNRAGLELYPTLEVIPASSKTATFLAHSAVPVNVTEEDLEQVTGGNFVVKVIYLPDPAYQDLTAAGPDEIVSSRLEPGVDPVAEAQRRGSVLAILRIGNIDLEAPNTPSIDTPPGGPINGPSRPMMAPPGRAVAPAPPGVIIDGPVKPIGAKMSASVDAGMYRLK